MLDYYILLPDKKVKKIKDMAEWEKWMEKNRDEKVVNQEDLGEVVISTVFLGLDHGALRGGPLLFETMVFEKKEDGVDFSGSDMERYPTYEEAEKGHMKMVIKWKNKINKNKKEKPWQIN